MDNLTKKLQEMTTADSEALIKLYGRVFNCDDGQLVLQDLKNRCFYNAPANDQIEEGMRRVVLHINTMLIPIERVKGEPDGED